jgi:hypothetical protein
VRPSSADEIETERGLRVQRRQVVRETVSVEGIEALERFTEEVLLLREEGSHDRNKRTPIVAEGNNLTVTTVSLEHTESFRCGAANPRPINGGVDACEIVVGIRLLDLINEPCNVSHSEIVVIDGWRSIEDGANTSNVEAVASETVETAVSDRVFSWCARGHHIVQALLVKHTTVVGVHGSGKE